MEPSRFASLLVVRIGLAIVLALAAGVLLTVTLAVSAQTAHPVGLSADQPVPEPRARAAQAVPSSQQMPTKASQAAPERRLSATAEVQRAWQQAGDLGVYHFATTLVERQYPASSLANVGSGPQEQEARMEGEVDLPAHRLTLRLWQGGGSAANPADAAEMLIEGDKAYTRRAGSGTWLPAADFTGSFAPGSDPLSYLAGIKNVARLGTDARALPGGGEVRFTRYGFDMDGPALAAYLRDQLEQVLRDQGKLPPGVTLETAQEYRDLAGRGELWLDEAGLPLRLVMHVAYPPAQNGAHAEADLQTDFSDFPQVAAAPAIGQNPAGWAAATLGLTGRRAEEWQARGQTGLALVIALGLLVLVVACRRSRRVYVAVAVAVILAMTVVPLLQKTQAAAYMNEQAVRQAKAAESQAAEEKAQEFAARQASWDPHRDPLAAQTATAAPAAGLGAVSTSEAEDPCAGESKTADGDKDGLSNYQECLYGSDPGKFDTDGDGLNDGQEINYLGTNPDLSDTDGDMLTDTLEVQGFVYPANGQHWYLDPRNPDTNGDGAADGTECPPLRRGDTTAASIASECDANADGVPNPFDDDNDGDGVPDRIDLSPIQVVDRGGVRSNLKTGVSPFSADHPFSITVTGLEANWPSFLDVQVRPEEPKHLTYALNVLDWPQGDGDGQIQHVKDTTFATTDNAEIRDEDSDAAKNGDMKLVPVLEITMKGSSLPLKLATPAVTTTVAAGSAVFSTTVRLEQDKSDGKTTHMAFTFAGSGTFNAKITSDPCPGTGSTLWSATSIDSNTQNLKHTDTATGWLNAVADSNHALVLTQGKSSACANISNIVNGPYKDQMVDMSVLQPYGIGLRELSDDLNTPVVAYVPLNAVTDDTTGKHTAFSGRMVFWTGGDSAWVESQEMRVVWVVQALTDSCDMADFPASLEEYQVQHPKATQEDYDEAVTEHCLDPENRTADEIQAVQTYDEPFHITGLEVTEEHGMDVAVVYPNPAKPYDDTALWDLSWGLGQMFIPGRDCENDTSIHATSTITDSLACKNADHKRDLTVYADDSRSNPIGNSTIYGRWGTDGSDWKNSHALWGVAPYSLAVESYRYPTSDYLSWVASKVTPPILEKYGHDTAPTLLFAREERYRSAGLEAGTVAGGLLTMNVSSGNQNYREQTLAGMSWAPFHYNTGKDAGGQTIGWEAYPIDEYYESLDARLQTYFTSYLERNGYVVDPEAVTGQAMVADAYYVSQYIGTAGLVEPCPQGEAGEACLEEAESESDEEIIEAGEKAGDVMIDITGEILEALLHEFDYLKATAEEFNVAAREAYALLTLFHEPGTPAATLEEMTVPIYKSLAKGMANYFGSPWKTMFSASKNLVTGATLVIGGAVAVVFLSFALGSEAHGKELGKRILLSAGTILNTLAAVNAMGKFIHEAQVEGWVPGWSAPEHAGEHVKHSSKLGGFTRMVLQDVLLWACWGLAWGLSGMAANSLAWQAMLSNTIAWTFTALIMFGIACIPIFGPIIVAVIGAIDALVRQICDAFLSPEQQESEAAQWMCGGITGVVTNIMKRLTYSGSILPDMDPDDFDRLQFSNFEANDLLYPDRGITYGNAVRYRIGLTNTIDLAAQPSSIVSWSAMFLWDADHLRHSTFKYEWQTEEEDIHGGLSLGGMPSSAWKPVKSGNPDPLFYTTTLPSEAYFPLPEPGINRSPDLYLSEGYAVPEAECWGLLIISGCGEATIKDTAHYPFSDTVKFDVLPADLDGFYKLQSTGGGYRLAWDGQFPALQDADGDGLPFGIDSDDTQWDTDGDGLTDEFEVNETGSDPALADTDSDGLNDAQEAQLGTNPRLADSDGDGLYDCREAFHRVLVPDKLGSKPGDECGTAGWSGGWGFVYGWSGGQQIKTWVNADPTDSDGDADTYPDSREQAYGFHPGVPSQAESLTLDSQVTEKGSDGKQTLTDNYVLPGDKLQYTATVKNELDAREAEGMLWTEGSSALDQSGLAPQSYLLMPQEEKALAGSLGVGAKTPSGVYSLTQVAGALITDWSELSGDADLWLPFDDATDATGYMDRSGSVPPNDGKCVDLGGQEAGGHCSIVTGGGRYGNALQLDGKGYVHSGAATNLSAFSWSLWFKLQSSQATMHYALLATDAAWGPVLTLVAGGNSIVSWAPYNRASYLWQQVSYGASDYQLADGKWHQAVVSCQGHHQDLYVDGQALVSFDHVQDCGDAGAVRIGGPSTSSDSQLKVFQAFPGQIDDVQLFPRALTATEVREMYNQPVFRMDFEEHTFWSYKDVSNWKDVSSYGAPVALTNYTAIQMVSPYAVQNGAVGWAGRFGVSDKFSQSPTAGGEPLSVGDTYPNAQLDLSGGKFTLSAWLYPFSASCSFTQLSEDQYILGLDPSIGSYPSLIRETTGNAVDLSFTPNGGSGVRTARGPALPVDTWTHLVVTYDKDGAATTGQARFYLNGELKTTAAFGNSGEHPAPPQTRHFYIGAPMPFNYMYPYLYTTYAFCGLMDEVQIFSYALADDGAEDLMLQSATALHLALDEPPGASAFADDSTVRHAVGCSSPTCPTSGVDGRVNHGVQFNAVSGHSGDRLVLENSEINRFTDRVTVAAWVKLDAMPDSQRIVSTGGANTANDGWGFGTAKGELMFSTDGVKTYTSSGANLQTGRWYHAAAAFDAITSKTLQFYLNGVPLGAPITGVTAGTADSKDQLFVGAGPSATLSDEWHGSIDDLVILPAALSASQLKGFYSRAPAMHLRLDDARGATSFANAADPGNPGKCSGSACPLAGEGVKGQVGLAAQFDGQDDAITLSSFGSFTKTTASAWIKLTGATKARETVISYKEPHSCGFVLSLNEDGASQYPRFWVLVKPAGGSAAWQFAESKTALPPDTWVNLAGTYDGQTIRLYQNGSLVASTAAPGTMANDCAITGVAAAVGNRGWNDYWRFPGLIDESRVFDHALSAAEIHDTYVYENGWVEDRESRDLTVDADNPTVDIVVPIPGHLNYMANYPAEMLIKASDPTSPVDKVQFCGETLDSYRCSLLPEATPCAGGDGSTWCATYTPSREGPRQIDALATDRVGHWTLGQTQTMAVDDTPPNVTLSSPGDSWYTATEYEHASNTWAVHFSGSVSDPSLGTPTYTVPGIGVPADGVRVTLYRQDGGLVASGTQTATVTGGAWAIDYLLQDADPSGCYTARVEAVDELARKAGLPGSQIERHTKVLETAISIDADPPSASIDWSNLPAAQLGPAADVVKGDSSENPVPVVLTFTGGTNSARSQVVLACEHGNSDNWWTPYSTEGKQLEPGQVTAWDHDGDPIIHHLSTCEVRLTTTAPTDNLSGNVTVCGEKVLEWSGDFTKPGMTYAFTVDSPGCTGGKGCPAGVQKATAGVKGVDVSFRPVTPGSPFFNDVPLAGEVLRLPMDTAMAGTGDPTFPDVSDTRLTGTCSGATCPVAGQQGHDGGAALFDGVDDYVTAGSNTALKLTTTGAIAFWIYPTANKNGPIVNREGEYEVYRYSDGTIRYALATTSPGWNFVSTGYTAPLNQWTHVVVVFDSGAVRAYLNGGGSYRATFTGSIGDTQTGMNELRVGGRQYNTDRFAGLIDDVRILNRALTADEVQALYTGSGPLVVLPFEEQFAADSSTVADTSGWGRDGTLHTGEGEHVGKVVTGQAGAYAIQFDGVDDYVAVGSAASLNLHPGFFTEAAWVYPDLPDSSYHGFLGYEPAGGEKQRYPGLWLHQNNRVLAGFGDGTHWNWMETSALSAIQPRQWSHLAATFDGTTYAIYLNGAQVYATTKTGDGLSWSAVRPYTMTEGITIGKTETKFRGRLDDARVYPRALSAAEIQALYLTGWQATTVTPSGQINRSAQWQITTPKWLEGSYRIEARGWDTAGHTAPPRSSAQTWSGEADTLAPRVTLTRSGSAGAYHYTATAEDYNLTQTGLVTPCPSGTAIVTTNFQSPWYMAAYPTSPKLYRLVQECTVAAAAASEKATACDTFDNCATANVTVATSAAEVPADVQAARAAAAEQAAADAAGEAGRAVAQDTAAATPLWPALAFVPTVITTTHFYPPAVVELTGLVTGTHIIKNVTVTVGGVSGQATIMPPATPRSRIATWRFPWPLGQSPLPDGVPYTAVAIGTSDNGAPIAASGPVTAQVTAQLLVDVAPPGPVTPTLQSGGQTVVAGDTVRTAALDLVLRWPAAGDGSGVAGYTVRWRAASSITTTQTVRSVGPGGPLEDRYTAGEAQRLTVELGSRDRWGNARWQALEPVYADSPLTPDFIALGDNPYQDWQDSGCAFLGADRRLELLARGARQPQQLYATWDQAALRLAWTGATWSGDGDLFVYLDTGPGGTNTFHNPVDAAGDAKLTTKALRADYLVWVQDAHTATLLRWDGSAWVTAAALSADQFRFDPSRQGGQTDLHLPFDLINLSPGSALGLLAVAAEEPVAGQALRLWATLPQFNPVNSPRVNHMLNFVPPNAELVLRHAYLWPALGDGICPNGSDGSHPGAHYGDVSPQLSIQSDPPGAGLSGLGRGLFWVPDSLLGDPGALEQAALRFAVPVLPPVAAGRTIVYTVRYRNAGAQTQHGVRLELTGNGVNLTSSVLDLGDVEPGEEAQVSFQGEIEGAGTNAAWASVKGLLYDTAHPTGDPLDWLWIAHRVDQDPPEAVGITRPTSIVGPVRAAVAGMAFDESGVAGVEVEIAGPNGTSTLPCPVIRPAEGRWGCAWDVGGAADGTTFTLRARATDTLGHTGGWSSSQTVRVDARPPEIRVTSPLTATVVRGAAPLFGSALDESGLAAVRVCVDGNCARAALLPGEEGSVRWMVPLPGGASDYVSKTIAIDGRDRAGNWSQPLELTFTQDNVAPALAADQVHAQAPLGQKQPVLQGEVHDGGPRPRVSVLVRAPDGTESWRNTARDGDRWWYELPADMLGRYTFWLQAVDGTGNTRTMGPYAVDVACTAAALEAALSVARLEATNTYTFTAVVTNTGPAQLPAGVPVTFYAGDSPLAAAQLLPALGAGQSAAVSAGWTRPGSGAYLIRAVVNEPRVEALCQASPVGWAWVGRDVDLRISKTVQPAAAKPGDVITYTLVYTNAGTALATGVTISDPLPVEILAPAYQASGAVITPTVGISPFAWEAGDLASGQGGRIVINGTVAPTVTLPLTITNVVTITSPLEGTPDDNVASVALPVVPEIKPPAARVWLPLVMR